MVQVDEYCEPVVPGAMRQAGEDEALMSPSPRRLAWWQFRRAPVKAPFDDVWQAERPRIWALAVRLTGSSDDAEDVAQEVAVRALRGWEAFRGDADVRTWLYRITLNTVSRHRSGPRERLPEYGEVAAPLSDQPEERLLRAEGAPALREALAALPEEFRIPLVLQVYEEMKCREIADLLGLPLGTILSRLHTARKRLLTHLSEREIDENAL
ncbi:MAG: sigma-70 family RNA polymerase sigma factor [Armatimonadota bacterium]